MRRRTEDDRYVTLEWNGEDRPTIHPYREIAPRPPRFANGATAKCRIREIRVGA